MSPIIPQLGRLRAIPRQREYLNERYISHRYLVHCQDSYVRVQ